MKHRKLKISLFIFLLGGSAHSQSITNGIFSGNFSIEPNSTNDPQQPGNLTVNGEVDIYGNTLDFGSAGSMLNPGLIFNYTDDAIGTNSTITSTSYRNFLSWKWQQNSATGQKSKMSLNQNNKLALFDLTGASKIELDPLAGQITVNGKALLLPNALGNVGIGTTSPNNPLHVVSTSSATPTTLKIQNISGSLASAEVFLGTSSTLTVSNVGASLFAARTNAVASGDTDLLFKTSAGTSLTTKLAVKSNGNIGVGTTTPTARLEVVGDAKVSGISTSASIVTGTVTAAGIITCAPGGDIPMYSGF